MGGHWPWGAEERDFMGRRLKFYEAAGRIEPSEINAMVPMVYPMTCVGSQVCPGVAKFPIDEWLNDGKPCFGVQAGWLFA